MRKERKLKVLRIVNTLFSTHSAYVPPSMRRIFGPKRDEVTGEWRKLLLMKSLMVCTSHPILFG